MDSESKPAISTSGKNIGRKSQCEPLAEIILAKVEVGLSSQRIYQDLVEENGFSDSYQSVKRFVRKLKVIQPERVWRLECRPGEEVQVDFGLGAPTENGQGKVRRSWVFRMVLSYSRKGYSEAVSRQDTETFLRCLENGFDDSHGFRFGSHTPLKHSPRQPPAPDHGPVIRNMKRSLSKSRTQAVSSPTFKIRTTLSRVFLTVVT